MKRCLVVISILSLLLSGCWSRRELNELGITFALGLDEGKNGNVRVTAQMVDPGMIAEKTGGGGSDSPVTNFSEEGKTVFEAVRKITKDSPRKVYPAHLRILIISESLAKKGIGHILDILSRDWEVRSDFLIVIAKKQRAEQILKIATPIEKIPANSMYQSLTITSKVWAQSSAVVLDKLIQEIVSKGKQPVLSGINIVGNIKEGKNITNIQNITPNTYLKFDNVAVFHIDKLIGWLNDDESKTYNLLMNNVFDTVVNIKCPSGGKAVIEIIRSKTKIKGKVVGDKPNAKVVMNMEGNVGEVECNIDLTKPHSIAQLEKVFKQQETAVISKSIKDVQRKFQSDIYGFGEAVHRSNPKYWSKVENDWDKQYFVNLPVDIKINIKLRRVGTIGNSFMQPLRK
ncbi:Ger(x)C family spore germination protein [Neobacillus fumarioli]|uniref:Ger(x)C family spore germination protein n=1 Tax=Neobacillus fumarioli TaxID=105229 RepID=UPI00082B425A|nr:Ger(x)C family spore germination protein [Neobacillus fumarioli]